MYQTLFSLSLTILVMVSSIHAAEQGTRRVTPKSLTAVCEKNATTSNGNTTVKPQTQPLLDIGFGKIDSVYREGERVIFIITVRKDVGIKYLYVFNVDSAGQTTVLFPNAWHEQHGVSNRIDGGTQLQIPDANNKGFHIEVTGPNFGTENVIAVLTDEPINPAQVEAKSFTDSNVTPINTMKFKSLKAVIEKKVDSIVVEETIKTIPKSEVSSGN